MKKLIPTTINSGRPNSSMRKSNPRQGYCDEQGQTFSIPVSEKRVSSWKKSMEEKGYSF